MIDILHKMDITQQYALDEDSGDEGEELDFHNITFDDPNTRHMHEDIENDLSMDHDNGFTLVPGTPDGWTRPLNPDDFNYTPKYDTPVSWEEVDNPGKWSQFSYQAKYDTDKNNRKYAGHFTPGRATAIPTNQEGKQIAGDFEFFQGWEASVVLNPVQPMKMFVQMVKRVSWMQTFYENMVL